MRQTGLLGVAVLGLVIGAGCRSNCNDRCDRCPRTDLASRIGCREPDRAACAPCMPTSIGRPASVTPADTLPPAGWTPDAGYGYPGGYPAYPGGDPIPVRPGTMMPPNELPYPNIPAPNVPESPAQPVPAIPGAATSLPSASARTTGEPRQSK